MTFVKREKCNEKFNYIPLRVTWVSYGGFYERVVSTRHACLMGVLSTLSIKSFSILILITTISTSCPCSLGGWCFEMLKNLRATWRNRCAWPRHKFFVLGLSPPGPLWFAQLRSIFSIFLEVFSGFTLAPHITTQHPDILYVYTVG